MSFGKSSLSVFAALVCLAGGSGRAENILVGTLIDDSGFLFSSFGNQYNRGATRGANFGGSAVSWYGVNMSSISGANGISWTGTAITGAQYGYSGIYTGSSPGTGAAADNLTNTGIFGAGTSISISATAGMTYVIDLLFANQFNGSTAGGNYYPYRIFDVSVGGLLYADDLALYGTESADRRPLVYRFEVTPTTSTINITMTAGPGGISGIDPTPYVNAMMVTVPEPTAFSLLVVGLGGVVALRRVRRKAD